MKYICSEQTWPFQHYDKSQDIVYCHTCVTAIKLDRMIMRWSNSVLKLLLSKVSPIGKVLLPALKNTKPPNPTVKLLKPLLLCHLKITKKCWRAIKQGVYSSKGTGKGILLIQCSFSCQARLVLRGGGTDASSNLIQL